MSRIVSARVIVTCPGRNFVTLKIETDDGVTGVGDATLNGRELAVASYLDRPRHPVPDRPRRAPDRGHLAVPLPRRLLAARPGDDDARSPRSTWRCGTSRPRSPACRSTSCSAARAATGVHGLRPRQRRRHRGDGRRRAAATRSRATRRSALQSRRAGAGIDLRRVARTSCFYEPADADLPTENVWSTREVPALASRSCSRRRARRSAGTSTCCTTSTTA